MQVLGAGAHAQQVAELAQPPAGQAIARRQADVVALEAVAQRAHPLAVGGIALVVAPAALERARVGRAVDVLDARPDRRQAAGHEGLAQPLGGDRQVGHDAQPAEALAEHAPALDAQLPADVLGVAHDRVGAEVREVLGLLGRGQSRQRADRRRAPGPALVEHEDAEVGQGAVQPAGRARVPGGPGRLAPRPALQEDEPAAGRARRASATSRANTVMVSPSGRAWSSGTASSCSVSTRPRVAYEAGMPGFSTLRARGPQRARDPGPRLPAREAAHDARRLPPEPQRAAPGLQPGDQPRSRHRVRRGGHPRRAAPPVAAALGAAGQRRGQPRAEVPPPARRGAGAARGRARGAVRAHAPRARRRRASSSSARSACTRWPTSRRCSTRSSG